MTRLLEQVLLIPLLVVSRQAARADLVGDAAQRLLRTMHAPASTAIRVLTRLEEATRPPAR